MGLLQPAQNMQGYLKVGIFGLAGSGKTFTASGLAIALAHMDKDRPVAFMDTEAGSSWMIPKFEAAGIKLQVAKTRAFSDMLTIVKEAEAGCSVLIVDSITHVWRELCESYARRRGIKRLQFQHWAELKQEWAAWTDAFLNGPIHCIVCGRAGWEYAFEKQDDGTTDLVKTGTKMKVENEFGYEPSLLLELVRVPRSAEPGAGWIHRCHVLKDRADEINGMSFDNPTLADFAPVLARLNQDGKHLAIDTTRTSEGMFDAAGSSGADIARMVTIALEEIEGVCRMLWPSTKVNDKMMKVAALEALFGTRSWTSIQGARLDRLQRAVAALKALEQRVAPDAVGDRDAVLGLLATILGEIDSESVEAAVDDAFCGPPEDAPDEPPDTSADTPSVEPPASPSALSRIEELYAEEPAFIDGVLSDAGSCIENVRAGSPDDQDDALEQIVFALEERDE